MPTLPPGSVDRAAAFLRGDIQPVATRDAATVALVRDGAAGVEVFLLRRVKTMAFAAGMHVFPGGAVDVRDVDDAVAWVGPSPEAFPTHLGCDHKTARALVCAAVRETFEECGVLFASSAGADAVGEIAGGWEDERRALASGEVSLASVLRRRGMVLRSDLLQAWSRWVTPEFEPRRYDTWFFVAAVPSGQRPRAVPGESDGAAWVDARSALDRYEAGELAMLPPTAATLRELSAYDDVAGVLRAQRRVVAQLPRAVVRDGQVTLEIDEW